jgi:hypothetical protein
VLLDLADARVKMTAWLAAVNTRVHGTTRQVPAVVFAAQEAPCLLPTPAGRYQVPYWAQVKVHVDYHTSRSPGPCTRCRGGTRGCG